MELLMSISELNQHKAIEIIGSGSQSTVYLLENNAVFKYFNEDYRDLNDEDNKNFFESIKKLASLDGAKRLIKPTRIIAEDDQLIGYIMPYIDGKELCDEFPKLNTIDIYLMIVDIIPTLFDIANAKLNNDDIHSGNVLIVGNHFKLFDFDLSIYDSKYDSNILFYHLFYRFFTMITMEYLSAKNIPFLLNDSNIHSYFDQIKNGDVLKFVDCLKYIAFALKESFMINEQTDLKKLVRKQ